MLTPMPSLRLRRLRPWLGHDDDENDFDYAHDCYDYCVSCDYYHDDDCYAYYFYDYYCYEYYDDDDQAILP